MGHGYIWAKTALCCCRRRRRCLFYTVHVQNLSRSVASPLSQLQQEFSELLLLLVSSFYFVELYPRCHGVGSDLTSPWSLTEMLLYRDMSMALRLWSSVGKWLPCVWNERSMMMMITDCALFRRNCQIRVCVCVCVYSEKEIPWLRFFTLASDESTRNTQNPPSCLVWSTSIFPNPESSKGVKLSVSCCCRKIIDSGVTWWSGVTVTTPKKCFIPRTVFI